MVFVQYSVGHHDDDEKQASPWVEKVQAGWGANHLVSHVDVTDSGMYDRTYLIGYDLAVSCAAALLTG